MPRLLALAVRVEPLAKVADALLERAFYQCGKWEGLETTGFVINRAIFESASCCESPDDMDIAGKDGEIISSIQSKTDKAIVR